MLELPPFPIFDVIKAFQPPDSQEAITIAWVQVLFEITQRYPVPLDVAEARDFLTGLLENGWKANLIVASLLHHRNLGELLHADSRLVFHEFARFDRLGHLGRQFGAATNAIGLTAYRVLTREEDLGSLETHLLAAMAFDAPEGGTSMTAQEKALMATTMVAILGSVLALVWLSRRSSPSPEFQSFAKLAPGKTWAEKLLKQGDARSWRLLDSWHAANLTDAEKREASEALGAMGAGFTTLVPARGEKLEPSKMHGDGHAFVVDVEVPGLMQGSIVIERARVITGTSDYLALLAAGEDETTRTYAGLVGDLDPAHQLDPVALANLEHRSADPQVLDRWLGKLIAASPDNSLRPIATHLKQALDDGEMLLLNQVQLRSQALVSEIRHAGLKRAQGGVLLKAAVLAEVHIDDPYSM